MNQETEVTVMVDRPLGWPVAGAAVIAGMAGLAVAAAGTVVVACGVVIAVLTVMFSWPHHRRISSLRSREVLLSGILFLYVLLMLTLGRTFATVGRDPIYVPEALIALAVLLMVPKLRLKAVRPLPLLCSCIAVLALHATYIGLLHDYPDATKGLALAFYPVIAVAVAAWFSDLANPNQALARIARYILPLTAVGLGFIFVTNRPLIAASYGLYLGIAASFAVAPRIPNRRLIALSTFVGFGLLIALTAKRGPALTILLACLAAWIAGTRWRSRTTTAGVSVTVLAVIVGTVFVFSTGLSDPTRVPIAGPLIARALAPSDSNAANNVQLRTTMWSYALQTTYTKNPLLGVGAFHPVEVTFHETNSADDPGSGVHNSFVGYVFYAGFPAGILVLFVFGLGLWRVWRIRHLNIYAPALFGALVAAVTTALTNVALETTYIGGPCWLVLAAAFGLAGSRTVYQHADGTGTGR